MRGTLLAFLLACASTVAAQTYFYIDAIEVQPQQPTPADVVSVNLVGGLSSTGAYVVSSSAQVIGTEVIISIVAADPGGFTVIVPHTEVVELGLLAAGTYTISFAPVNVGDYAPVPQHTFTVTGAGPSCDSVFISSVYWHPFLDDALVVHSYHYLLDTLFSPHLVLLGTGGDTLAQEINPFPYMDRYVDYWHTLPLEEGVTLPDNTAEGTLQLFSSGFTGAACSFAGPFNLCPTSGCISLMPVLQNLGGGITTGEFAWNIYDAQSNLMALGSFTLNDAQQADTGYACLEPGSYTLDVAPLDPPSGGQPYFGVTLGSDINGPSAPVNWSLPVPMPFDFYGPCAQVAQGVPDQGSPALLTHVDGEVLHVWRTDGEPLGATRLFDAHGSLVQQDAGTSSDLRLHLGDRASGLYVLLAGTTRLKVIVP